MQISLTVTAITIILFSMFLVGNNGRVIAVVLIISLLLRLGVLSHKENDDLMASRCKIDSKNRELLVLVDAATAIASQEKLDDILKLLAKRLTSTANCLYSRVLLASEDNCSLTVRAASIGKEIEWDPALGHIIEVTANSYLSSLLTSVDQSVTLNYQQMQQMQMDMSIKRALLGCSTPIKSLILAPIKMRDEFLGIIVVGESESHDSALLEAAAVSVESLVKHAGIAAAIGAKNARYYEMLNKAYLESIITGDA